MPIFNDYANGKPLKEIADELNSQGFRTVNGKMFNVRNLRQILKDDKYTHGLLVSGRESVEIIDAVSS